MLKRLLLAFALSTALVAADAAPAQAAPAIAAIGAFVATPLGGIVANVVIGMAASAAGTLIRQMTGNKSPSSGAVAGIRGSAASGGDVPLSFIMGYRMTAGSFAYRGTWGSAGKTPNAYYVEERILADLPMPNLLGLWVGDKKVTVDWEAEPLAQGYPVLEGRVDGKDHWWIRFHDGTQTVADAYMRAKFGAHPDHPYTADMVGRGQTKVIFTCLINRDLLTSWPRLRFETDGIRLYDVSKDTTAGGDGPQRIADPSTWQPSDLLPVHIYNALIGIRYGGSWVWGGQNIGVTRLPAASWIAAIAEARASVDLAGGGTEKQFRGGFEVTGNMEPQGFIKEALKGCAGRMAEIGGIYKILCGVPASSVFSFTDRDIIITRDQGFDPYPVLEQTHNAIRATYVEPGIGWATKDAPPRYSDDLEAEDQGRHLAIDVSYEMVYSGTQVQRLMKAAIEEARRFRRHALVLPPEASELEPLDVVSWSSAANGYTSKKFIITDLEDEPTYLTPLSLQEIDPADYDFDPSTDEQPYTVGGLTTSPMAPQVVADWAVMPWTHVDDGGAARRPGIKMFWDGDQPDVRALLFQVALPDETIVLSGEFASEFVAGEGTTPIGSVLPLQDYLVRSKYDPISSRPAEWTDWTPVTTPNVLLGAQDINIELEAIAGDIAGKLNWAGALARSLVEDFRRLGSIIEAADLENYNQRQLMRRELEVRLGDVEAGFLEVIEVALGPGGSIATALSSIYAALGGNSAQVNIRFQAVAAPAGVNARWAVQVRTDGDTFGAAGMYLEVLPDGSSRIILDADQTLITTDGGTTVQAVFDADGALIRNLRTATIEGPVGNFWNLTTGAFRVSGGS